MSHIATAAIDSPVGPLALAARGRTLLMLEFASRSEGQLARILARFPGATLLPARDPGGVVSRLAAYFDGDLGALDAIEVDPGGTPFQAAVWARLRRIPVGETLSYAELAASVGRPAAVRAVGQANGANPIAIVIPCHRVVRTGGHLGGYGGGLPIKRWLLGHERADPGRGRLLALPVGAGDPQSAPGRNATR